MQIRLRRSLVTLGAALGLLLATSGAGAGAAAPPTGFHRCPVGKFCLFDKANGQGNMIAYSTSQASLGAWDNKAVSTANRTGSQYSCYFSRANFKIADGSLEPLVSGDGPANGNIPYIEIDWFPGLKHTLSSFRVADTWRECETGIEYSPWYALPAGTSAPKPGFGDLNGDRTPDVLQRNHTGRLWFLPGDESGRLLGGGWNAMTALTRHGDLDGNGTEDLIARDTTGKLWFYPGNGKGAFGARKPLGGGWNAMRRIVVAGDLNGDRKGDLLAADVSGKLWLYPGNGKGSFGARKLIGGGWQVMPVIGAGGDMNRDGRSDIVATDRSGKLWFYPGNGKGAFGTRVMIGTGGWGAFGSITSVGDVDGDGRNDLIAQNAHSLVTYPGTGTGRLGAGHSQPGWDLSIAL